MRCDFCGQPLKGVKTTSLVFPREREPMIVHDMCAERHINVHYEIGLDRLVSEGDPSHPYADGDSLESWKAHMGEKNWFWWPEALERAHEIARALAAPKRHRQKLPHRTRARVLERDQFRCRRCGASADSTELVIDHVVPLKHNGHARLSNLQTLCWSCNSGKRDHLPHPHDLLGLA